MRQILSTYVLTGLMILSIVVMLGTAVIGRQQILQEWYLYQIKKADFGERLRLIEVLSDVRCEQVAPIILKEMKKLLRQQCYLRVATVLVNLNRLLRQLGELALTYLIPILYDPEEKHLYYFALAFGEVCWAMRGREVRMLRCEQIVPFLSDLTDDRKERPELRKAASRALEIINAVLEAAPGLSEP